MPIGDMTMIAASSTVFVCIYGRILLKEEISKINILNILLVLSGIFLITKPSFIFGDFDDVHEAFMSSHSYCTAGLG